MSPGRSRVTAIQPHDATLPAAATSVPTPTATLISRNSSRRTACPRAIRFIVPRVLTCGGLALSAEYTPDHVRSNLARQRATFRVPPIRSPAGEGMARMNKVVKGVVCLAAGIAVSGSGLAGAGGLRAAVAPGTDRSVPEFGILTGVAASSARNAWAVGQVIKVGFSKSLILHWNGRAWHRVASPAPAGAFSVGLFEVAATSARNAWAVGQINLRKSLILHWNGTAWKQVPIQALLTPPASASSGWPRRPPGTPGPSATSTTATR